MLHPDFDYALGKERVVQIRAEVERSRLEARLARETRSEDTGSGEGTVLRRGMATRGAGFVAAQASSRRCSGCEVLRVETR